MDPTSTTPQKEGAAKGNHTRFPILIFRLCNAKLVPSRALSCSVEPSLSRQSPQSERPLQRPTESGSKLLRQLAITLPFVNAKASCPQRPERAAIHGNHCYSIRRSPNSEVTLACSGTCWRSQPTEPIQHERSELTAAKMDPQRIEIGFRSDFGIETDLTGAKLGGGLARGRGQASASKKPEWARRGQVHALPRVAIRRRAQQRCAEKCMAAMVERVLLPMYATKASEANSTLRSERRCQQSEGGL